MSQPSPDDAFANLRPGKPSGAATGTGIAIGGILVAIVAVIMCCGLPVLLLLPAINSARLPARRSGCLNNMRQLAIAVQNHESAQKRFPTASNGTTDLLKAQTAGGHGAASAASDDGFSWLYQILPYIEEEILFKAMRNRLAEDDAQTGPFDADFVADNGQHFAEWQIPSYRCPSFSGDMTTSIGDVKAAVGNYCAIVGTDLTDGDDAYWKTTPNWEDGGLPSACWNTKASQTSALSSDSCVEPGLRLRDMIDGISKTIIAVESREEQVNAWISGTSTWVVAASPNSLASDKVEVRRSKEDLFIAIMLGDASVEEDGKGLALNFGAKTIAPRTADCYLQASDWATSRDRVWGPSSEHADGVVIHVFADAHAQAISPYVNPTVYLRFVTRNEGDGYYGCSLE